MSWDAPVLSDQPASRCSLAGQERGCLFVFEGPDGVGKSTLARRLTERLASWGVSSALLAFPGRESGTLGELVYRLHHAPGAVGVGVVAPTSLQLLHVAAHLDAIDTRIRPLIAAGTTVVLDRFWWSTWVYGLVDGAAREALESMIALERRHWGALLPDSLFLVTRATPLRHDGSSERWARLRAAYAELAAVEAENCPVHVVSNDETPDETLARVLPAVAALNRDGAGSLRLGQQT